MKLGLFDTLWYMAFPPNSELEIIIDQLPDVVVHLSKGEPFICSFVIILSLGLAVLICMPFDMLFNHSKIFEINTVSDYVKSVASFLVVLIVGTPILWLPIKLFGRIIGYFVWPFEWVASFILGRVYSVISFFI